MPTLRKTHFANTIKPGLAFTTAFILTKASKRAKQSGGHYWAIQLTDRTGTIEARKWGAEIGDAIVGEFCIVTGLGDLYDGETQVKVEGIRALKVDEFPDMADFVPQSPHDRAAQRAEILEIVHGFSHDGLRAICEAVIDDEFCAAPAAKTLHHAYVGGLLAHVCSLVRLAQGVAAHYGNLDEELLIAACIWHDAGKVNELAWDKALGYTLEGSVIGHVILGLQRLRDAWSSYLAAGGDPETFTHLEHIVCSHHGQLEWGAAKKPMTREAQAFHLIDMIDSRMAIFDGIDEPVDANGLTGKVWALGTEVWRPKRYEIEEPADPVDGAPEKQLYFVGGPNVPGAEAR